MAIEKFVFALSHPKIGTYKIQAPTGWDSMQHTIARDAVYHGTSVSYTLDFDFVEDGFLFIEKVYETYGIQGGGSILLFIFEYDANEHKYFTAYQGKINLSKFNESFTDEYFKSSMNAEESGFVRKLLNLDDVYVDLTKLESIDGQALVSFSPDFIDVTLHSKATIKELYFTSNENQPEYDYRPATTEAETSGTLYVGFDNAIRNEFNAYSYPTGLQFSKNALPLIEFVESGNIKVEYKIDFHIECYADKGDFAQSETDFFIGLNLTGPPVNAVPATPKERIFSDNQSGLTGFFSKEVKASGIRNYSVNPGDSLYFLGYAGVFDTSSPTIGTFQFEWKIQLTGDNYIKVSGITKTAPTPAKGMLLHEAFTRVVQGLTGRNDGFYSELLGRTDSAVTSYPSDGELAFLMLANGSQIRGFPLNERPLYANLKELYNSTNSLRPIGLGIEIMPSGLERVRLEGVEYFYSKEVVLDLGNQIRNYKRYSAEEYYYTQTELGYEKWGSNEQNSLDEYNTKQTRLTPITELKGKYSALSKYVASGYLIEQTRRAQYPLGTDKEGSEDKTNFWVALLRNPLGGFVTERNQNLLVANNILDPDSIYNVRWSPMRNYMRHSSLSTVGLRHLESSNLQFQEGNANYIAETQFVGEAKSIIENMNISGSDMAPPLWLPEYYEFDAGLPLFKRLKLEQNTKGQIAFINPKLEQCYGYIKEIKANVADGDASFKLIRAK